LVLIFEKFENLVCENILKIGIANIQKKTTEKVFKALKIINLELKKC